MTTGVEQARLRRQIPARALKTLEAEIARGNAHFGFHLDRPATSRSASPRETFEERSMVLALELRH